MTGVHREHGVNRRTMLRWLAAATTAAPLLAAGCARGTQTLAAPDGLVTLNNDNATWYTGYEAASRELRKHAGHGLAVRSVPNVSSYQQIIRMSAQTDSTTDLVKWWNGYRLRDVARVGIFDDLTEAWDTAETNGWVDPSLRASFSYAGRPYAMPLYKSYYAMYYSKRAYRQANLELPRSWDDLIRNAAALRDKGIIPIASGGSATWESSIWFQQLLNGLDPDFYTALTTGEASYTDETAREAMRIWVEMYEQELFSAPDFSSSDLPGMLAEGSVGMALHATFNINAFVSADVGGDAYGLFLTPPVNPSANPAVLVESGALAVTANAHKPSAAHQVVGSWLADDVQRAWIGFLNDVSANPSVRSPAAPVRELEREVAQVSPQEAVRYWESSPPVLIEGNVQQLSGFMAQPTMAKANATLRQMQRNAETEWRKWSL